MPAALAVDWDAIKQAAIAGVPFRNLADNWGMADTAAIRQRASREAWPIPRAIVDKAVQRLAQAKAEHSRAITAVREAAGLDSPVTVSQASVTSLEEYAKRTQNAILPALVGQVEKAARDRPEAWEPNSLKGLQSAVTTIWKLTGRDRPGASVTLNFGSISNHGSGIQIKDAIEAEVVEDELDATE